MTNEGFLEIAGARIAGIVADVPRLAEMGQAMAAHLLAGGALLAPPVTRWWVSEFCNRAGGLMGIGSDDRSGKYEVNGAHDVAFVAMPLRWNDQSRAEWERVARSDARIFAIGHGHEIDDPRRVELFTGLGGECAAGARQLEQLVRGWIVGGEMVAACTRAGRMPHVWMSVWLEGALVRNASFTKHDNLREPWRVPLFHDRCYVPPMAPGQVAHEFLRELGKIHSVLVKQSAKLSQAGNWMADARRAGKRVSMVAVGHSYPEILEVEKDQWPVQWERSTSHVARAHPADLREGDVAVHLGYSPVDVHDVLGILGRGVRFVYSSPYGRPAELADHPNLIWLDLPWRPGDGTVDVPGYSVRILPMSSSAHTLAYSAIVEAMRRAGGPA